MSLIFNNYKFNEKYNLNTSPNNMNYYRQTDNYEKQRRKLLENSYNGNLNANFNYSPIVNKINQNGYSNPNSPMLNNNNYLNHYNKNK